LSISNYTFFKEHDEIIEIRDESNLKKLKTSGGYFESFIHIDGSIPDNWSDTTITYDWCSGDGSWSNPYIIENVTIDATGSPTGSGIYIENSKNDHFIIRNCTAYNSGTDYYDAGIKLENTNNGTLINNNCSNNAGCGIVLMINCENNTLRGNTANENSYNGIRLNDFCDNNTISENTVNYNEYLGVYLTGYCDYITISGNTVNDNNDEGIHLDSCNYNILLGNIVNNNNDNGIRIHRCNYNTLSGNTANYNKLIGMYLTNGGRHNILGNTVTDNGGGIRLWQYCDHNTISGNNISNNLFGIQLLESNDINISGNTANDNENFGIALSDSDNNTLSGNTAINNNIFGIYLWESINNDISGNTANDNENFGIFLSDSDNNTLSGNTVNNNDNGINLGGNNNTLLGNTANNNNNGIFIEGNDNNISGNTASDNEYRGILLQNCDGNYIMGNTVNDNGVLFTGYGIHLIDDCDNNTLSRNTANNNTQYGIYLQTHCDNNTISGNPILYNNLYGLFVDSLCNDNLIYLNDFIGNEINARDEGNNNQWDNGTIGNFWDNYIGIDVDDDGIGDTPYDLPPAGGSVDNYPIWDDGPHVINIISPNLGDVFETIAPNFNVSINFPIFDTSWYTLDNGLTNYTFNGTSGSINQTAWDSCEEGIVSIKFFVNNTVGNFSSAEITVFKDTIVPIIDINFPINNSVFRESPPVYYISIEEVNLITTWYTMDGGITNITFTELTGIINQNLWDALPNGHVTIRFYARDVADHIGYSDVIVIKNVPYNLLYVEIVDQSFSKDEFNITLFIFDENYQGIAFAIIQMWWNGEDISDNIINLGNGLYFISLEPITVMPGEDPILLSMIVSTDGYEDKHFETYLAVDPETLEKGVVKDGDEFPPTIIIIAVISAVGGIGATIITIGILRKRKLTKEVI